MPRNNPHPTERLTALCYIRQSYTRNENDMHSPERQRANIEAYCARKGWTPEWYVDAEGHKSGRSVQNRPGWLALERRLGDSDVVALVANDLARIHRKTWRIGQLLERLKTYGVQVILAEPGRDIIDTTTPMGEMYVTVLAMQDEAYANDISHRAKASIRYRKAQGKTVGLPPFGTIRNKEGFLLPSPEGAWLLPDGRFVAGDPNQEAPEPGAVWRGYHACAQRILEIYVENKIGLERIAYQMISEGWPYRDRNGQPRPMQRGDVRRVVALWRVYAGLSTAGRSRDKNASLLEDPVGELYRTGREVFSYELLYRVAETQKARSVTTRPFGSIRKAHPFALVRLVYCAHCEIQALEHNDPRLRSRLNGWNARGRLRYRHAQGIDCGCKTRSVSAESIESDFRRLLGLLAVDPGRLDELTELALQSEYGGSGGSEDATLERQKQAAIAKAQRRIAAAREL